MDNRERSMPEPSNRSGQTNAPGQQSNPGTTYTGTTGTGFGTSAGAGAAPTADVVEQAKDTVGQVVDQVQQQAKETVSSVMGQVQQQANSRFGEQIDGVSRDVGSFAEAVRSMGWQFRNGEQAHLAQFTDLAAGQIDGVAGFLRGKDLDQIVWEAERFARRQPGLFLAGATVLGMVAARFLRSSTPQPDNWSDRSGSMRPVESDRPYARDSYQPPTPRYTTPGYSGATMESGSNYRSTPVGSPGPGRSSGLGPSGRPEE